MPTRTPMPRTSVQLSRGDRRRLEAIIAARSNTQRARRAQVVLATAEGCGTHEIMRRTGLSKPVVWHWQERFARDGADGLESRPSGRPQTPAELVERLVTLARSDPPGRRWTVRTMAAATGLSPTTVHRLWKQIGLAPKMAR